MRRRKRRMRVNSRFAKLSSMRIDNTCSLSSFSKRMRQGRRRRNVSPHLFQCKCIVIPVRAVVRVLTLHDPTDSKHNAWRQCSDVVL